jgi:hypothetical protein
MAEKVLNLHFFRSMRAQGLLELGNPDPFRTTMENGPVYLIIGLLTVHDDHLNMDGDIE